MKRYSGCAMLLLAAALTLGIGAQARATPTPAPATRSTPAPLTPATSAPAAATRKSPSQIAAAPGGGPGQVWVNTASKVYHCAGTTYYGKTKAGKYLTEDAAKAEGDRPNGGKPCSK